jgi:hypothetical protein
MADKASNVWFTWRNAANTADLNTFRVDSGDHVEIAAGAGKGINFVFSGSTYFSFTTSGFRLYGGTHRYNHGSVTTSRTANYLNGTTQTYTLDGDTAFTFSGLPSAWAELTLILTQGTGGNHVPTFAGVKWAGGVVPTLSTTAGAVDIILICSPDAGTTKYGQVIGKGFA